MRVILTGNTGLVGHALGQLLRQYYDLLTPSRSDFNILDCTQIDTYLTHQKFDVIIHAAAYVNAGEAEKERGDTAGICYQTNVIGTKNVVESGNKVGIPTIYISTGSVFHGTDDKSGPFSEDDQPESNPDNNNWYGYTKYLGELTKPGVIIRISHPVVPDSLRIKDDYLRKMLRLYKNNTLHPMFPDQLFPLTAIEDVAKSIDIIIRKQLKGTYHVASPDLVSPYEMLVYALELLHLPQDERIKTLSVEEFYKQGNSQLRFAKYSALNSAKTSKTLGIEFERWKNIIQRNITYRRE